MRYVYMLRCADDSLYTGITTDLDRRVEEHNTSPKGAAYTRAKRPVTLVRSEPAWDKSIASIREYQIKKYPRSKKLSMITDTLIS